MKEKQILFNTDMVKAVLDGRKTQTRRIVKEPIESSFFKNEKQNIKLGHRWVNCPYGQPGDRLWVRETWADLRYTGFDNPFAYKATTSGEGDLIRGEYGIKWKPSIHMPREACRLVLDITDVRVERLQDITEDDAQAEGVIIYQGTMRTGYHILWNSINLTMIRNIVARKFWKRYR